MENQQFSQIQDTKSKSPWKSSINLLSHMFLRVQILPIILLLQVATLSIIGAFTVNDVLSQGHVYVNYNPSRDAEDAPPPAARHRIQRAYEPYCDAPTNREDSDLCAQWGAVAAVTESNQIARISVWLSLISIFATGVGAVLVMRSLQQADKANRFARQSMQIELRAYISINRQKVELLRDESGAIVAYKFIITWVNSGSTPAALASATASYILQYGGIEPVWQMLKFDNLSDHYHKNTIGAGQELHTNLIVDKSIMLEMDKGRNLYVWAACEYLDVFNKNKVHRSETCSKIYIEGAISQDTDRITGGYSGPFNGIDETTFLKPRRSI